MDRIGFQASENMRALASKVGLQYRRTFRDAENACVQSYTLEEAQILDPNDISAIWPLDDVHIMVT